MSFLADRDICTSHHSYILLHCLLYHVYRLSRRTDDRYVGMSRTSFNCVHTAMSFLADRDICRILQHFGDIAGYMLRN